jgi:ribosome-associated protein
VSRADVTTVAVRASGPGGQCVNKLSTAVQMRVPVTAIQGLDDDARERLRRRAGNRLTQADEILVHAATHRSQRANRRACLERLSRLVAEAQVVPRARKQTKPSRAAVERRLQAKRQRGDRKRARGRVEGD